MPTRQSRSAGFLASLCIAFLSLRPGASVTLPLPTFRQLVPSDVDGTFALEFAVAGSCPANLVVSGTRPNEGSTDIGRIESLAVDGASCSGGLDVVSPDVAGDPEKLQAAFPDQAEEVEGNNALKEALRGGIDQAKASLAFTSTPLTCGSRTIPAGTSFVLLKTESETQDIVVSDDVSDARQTLKIPAQSQASIIVGSDTLCLNQVAGSGDRQGTPETVAVPDPTPGDFGSIFVSNPGDAEEGRDITIQEEIIATVENSSGGNNGEAACFPGDATAELEGGEIVPLESLRTGDKVRSGVDSFSEVFFFTHREQKASFEFVQIRTLSGHVLRASAGHYIYANDGLRPAGEVQKGDVVRLGSGGGSPVSTVSRRTARGLYNPQTLHGDIVVDGILSSTYTTAVEPKVAHASLFPARWLYAWTGLTTSSFDSGSEILASVLPEGSANV